ncbi:MAG: OmpA family protein [Leadbetterella sp.]
MKIWTLFTLFICSNYPRFLISQKPSNERRLYIQPRFGLGVYIPSKQSNTTAGYAFVANILPFSTKKTLLDIEQNNTRLRSTNSIGIELGIPTQKKLDILVGYNRTNILIDYGSTFQFPIATGIEFDGLNFKVAYYDFSVGLKAKNSLLEGIARLHFVPDVYNNIFGLEKNEGIKTPTNFTFLNTGIRTEISNLNTPKILVSFGLKPTFIQHPFYSRLFIDFKFAFRPLLTEKINFVALNRTLGSTEITYGLNSVFLSYAHPFDFFVKKKKKKSDRIPDPSEEKNKEVAKIGEKSISVGTTLVLNHIQFEQTKYDITDSSKADLDLVYDFLTTYPDSKIELGGHTSGEGNRNDNIELSKLRAEACKKYLTQKGIASKRIIATGYGPDKPISQKDEKTNRRVEIRILYLR